MRVGWFEGFSIDTRRHSFEQLFAKGGDLLLNLVFSDAA
jgi:hypothetical protein